MEKKIEKEWKKKLKKEWKKKYFLNLKNFLKKEYKNFTCFPNTEKIFNSLNLCKFKKTKVIILGQDPYYKYNQANGLCFSVKKNTPIPPSLKNIFQEIKRNFNNSKKKEYNGDLTKWAIQGVLLLNSILTVRLNSPCSHKNKGWEIFTDSIIKLLSIKKNIVFLLWGNYAISKKKIINVKNNYILESSHPSPFSAKKSFIGCKHFIKTNIFLKKKGKTPIIW